MEVLGQKRTLVLLIRFYAAAPGSTILGIAVPLVGAGIRAFIPTAAVFGCAV